MKKSECVESREEEEWRRRDDIREKKEKRIRCEEIKDVRRSGKRIEVRREDKNKKNKKNERNYGQNMWEEKRTKKEK